MSALTDLFTSFANKIRSKVGGSQTYTPLQMVDAIDDVYDAGVASVPTPIDIIPSEYPHFNSGAILKPSTEGFAIDSFIRVTPSNSSPAALTPYKANMPYGLGFAIESYQSKTPSDVNPVSISDGAIIKASAAGYFTKKAPVNFGFPTIINQANLSANSSRNVPVTQTPRFICVLEVRNSDSTGRSYLAFYDVLNDECAVANYTSDGYTQVRATSGMPVYITSVTSSSVTISNPNAATVRSHVLIWY